MDPSLAGQGAAGPLLSQTRGSLPLSMGSSGRWSSTAGPGWRPVGGWNSPRGRTSLPGPGLAPPLPAPALSGIASLKAGEPQPFPGVCQGCFSLCFRPNDGTAQEGAQGGAGGPVRGAGKVLPTLPSPCAHLRWQGFPFWPHHTPGESSRIGSTYLVRNKRPRPWVLRCKAAILGACERCYLSSPPPAPRRGPRAGQRRRGQLCSRGATAGHGVSPGRVPCAPPSPLRPPASRYIGVRAGPGSLRSSLCPGQPLGPRPPDTARSGGGTAASQCPGFCSPCASLSARSGASRPHPRSQRPPRLASGARGHGWAPRWPGGFLRAPVPRPCPPSGREAAGPHIRTALRDRAGGCRFLPCREQAVTERESVRRPGKGECQVPGCRAKCSAPLPGFTSGSPVRGCSREASTAFPLLPRNLRPGPGRSVSGTRCGPGRHQAGAAPPAPSSPDPQAPRRARCPRGRAGLGARPRPLPQPRARRGKRDPPAAPGPVTARARMRLRPRRSVARPGLRRLGTVLFLPRLRARGEETKAEPGSGRAPGTAPRPQPPAPQDGHRGEAPAAAQAPERRRSRPARPRNGRNGPGTALAAAETAPGPGSSPPVPGGAQCSSRSRAPCAAPGRAAATGRERCSHGPGAVPVARSGAYSPEQYPGPGAVPSHSAHPALRCRLPIPSVEKRSEIKLYGKKERHFIGDFTMLESTMKVLVHSRKVGPKMLLCHSIYRFTQTFTKSL